MNALTPVSSSSGGVAEPPLARVPPLVQLALFLAITFALTWALFHALANAWSELLPLGPMVPEPAYLTVTAILWGAAVAVLLMNRGAVPRLRPA